MRRRKSLIESRDKSQDLGLPWAFRAQAVDRPRLARSRASKVTRFSAIARDKAKRSWPKRRNLLNSNGNSWRARQDFEPTTPWFVGAKIEFGRKLNQYLAVSANCHCSQSPRKWNRKESSEPTVSATSMTTAFDPSWSYAPTPLCELHTSENRRFYLLFSPSRQR